MANDILDPGPEGNYPFFPRDVNGDPARNLDKVVKAVDKDTHGKTVYADITPRTTDGRPVSSVAPRLTPQPATGGVTLALWLATGARVEQTETTTRNGHPLRIARNIDTGEQVEY